MMRYWSIEFEWKTRPMFRKGRLKRRKVAFAAEEQTQLYELARAEAKRLFPRHRWAIVGCEELTVAPKPEARSPDTATESQSHHP